MSEESNHTVVSEGSISTRLLPSPLSSARMSGTMFTASTSAFDIWVLGSNIFISSTSSPQKETLKGSLFAKEKISISEPLTANCPGALTKSTLSNPSPPRVFIIPSNFISCPFFMESTDPFIFRLDGILSSTASG